MLWLVPGPLEATGSSQNGISLGSYNATQWLVGEGEGRGWSAKDSFAHVGFLVQCSRATRSRVLPHTGLEVLPRTHTSGRSSVTSTSQGRSTSPDI